jgi:hypothetical protein
VPWRVSSSCPFLVDLPIPFGSVLLALALALMLVGLGLVFRDGVADALRLLVSGVAIAATIGLMLAAGVWGSEWVASWV